MSGSQSLDQGRLRLTVPLQKKTDRNGDEYYRAVVMSSQISVDLNECVIHVFKDPDNLGARLVISPYDNPPIDS